MYTYHHPDDTLNVVFTYANIDMVEETANGTVYLECTIRKTGSKIMVEGDDLDDACTAALRQIEDQVWTLDNIMDEYGLTLDELRAMVDFTPQLSERAELRGEPEPIAQNVTVLGVAQPYLVRDDQGKLSLMLDLIR